LCRGYESFKLGAVVARVWVTSHEGGMTDFLQRSWRKEEGQDVAEYAVMPAVILAIAIGTIRLFGSHAGNVFASVGSAIQ
jgi:Flp pilus assembly pilin Flp